MNKSYIKVYVVIAILILLVGFIMGIALGNAFPNEIEDGYGGLTSTFNYSLMLEVWGSSLIISVFVFAIYSICSRLDVLIKENPNYKKLATKKNTANKKEKNANVKKEESEYNW